MPAPNPYVVSENPSAAFICSAAKPTLIRSRYETTYRRKRNGSRRRRAFASAVATMVIGEFRYYTRRAHNRERRNHPRARHADLVRVPDRRHHLPRSRLHLRRGAVHQRRAAPDHRADGPGAERGKANGAILFGTRVGGMIGVPLVLLLIHQWGWRASFVIVGSTGLVWAV